MPRFSAKAKEIRDTIWKYTDIIKAEKLLDELKNPLDIAFGKLFIAQYFEEFQNQQKYLELLTEVENENRILKDKFIQFEIDNYYFLHYALGPVLMLKKEQSKDYLIRFKQSYQDMDYKDDWEKYYCTGSYYFTMASYEYRIRNNFLKAIKYQKKCIEVWSKILEDEEKWSACGLNNLGFLYMQNGDFEEAEKSYNRYLDSNKKYDNLYQLYPLFNLASLNFAIGNLEQANELNMQALDIAKRFNNIFGIYYGLTKSGQYYFRKGDFDESTKFQQESLVYRKQHGGILQIFWGYFNIFNNYYERFKRTTNKVYFTKAEHALSDLLKLSKTHSDDKIIINYTKYAQALIQKLGNMRKKSNAIDILEILVDTYPNNMGISLNLLELLFEDFLLSEDQETIDQIDELMEKIGKLPHRNNPQAIYSFVSQQIFLAKYIFYIKGDISVALKILYDTTEHVKKFKLYSLEQRLDAEIRILEKELTKWENMDITIKERIKASKFNRYIQQAMKLVDHQKLID